LEGGPFGSPPIGGRDILSPLGEIATEIPVILPLHPRARKAISATGLEVLINAPGCGALPYHEMMTLSIDSKKVITDGAGYKSEKV
jgi:UDP-N-acetylglucosamine 2-epimerase